MNYEIIGFRKCSGTSKKTGKPYSGYICYFRYISADTEGYVTDNAFLSDTVLEGLTPVLGMTVQLSYSRTGFLQAVNVVA